MLIESDKTSDMGVYHGTEDFIENKLKTHCSTYITTVFYLIGARGVYVNLLPTTSVKRSSSGR